MTENVWGWVGWARHPSLAAGAEFPHSTGPAGQLMVSGRKLLQIRLQLPADSLGCLTSQAGFLSELDCSWSL